MANFTSAVCVRSGALSYLQKAILMRRSLRPTAAILAAVVALALAGCSSSSDSDAGTEGTQKTSGSAEGWPRTVDHGDRSTEITSKPTRIVSTSPSLTGTLLAIGAPVVASAATTPSGMTDEQGFFSQWSDVAADRGVEVLYRNLELNLDAIETFEPDLIIGSANGGDSTLDAYAQLSDIAPTVLLDYGASSWEELADQLGTVTGLESEAGKTVDEYDSWVTTQAGKIKLPEQPVTALVYMGADGVWTFRADSPQGNLLTSLGFTYAEPAEQFVAPDKRGASGVAIVSSENMSAALDGSQTLFAVSMGPKDVEKQLAADPLLANQPAVKGDRVYAMGTAAFRLDYFSAKQTVESLVSTFGE